VSKLCPGGHFSILFSGVYNDVLRDPVDILASSSAAACISAKPKISIPQALSPTISNIMEISTIFDYTANIPCSFQ